MHLLKFRRVTATMDMLFLLIPRALAGMKNAIASCLAQTGRRDSAGLYTDRSKSRSQMLQMSPCGNALYELQAQHARFLVFYVYADQCGIRFQPPLSSPDRIALRGVMLKVDDAVQMVVFIDDRHRHQAPGCEEFEGRHPSVGRVIRYSLSPG